MFGFLYCSSIVVLQLPADNMTRQAVSMELSEDRKAELREAFDIFDVDKSGEIDFRELRTAFKAMGFEVPKDELRRMFDSVDTDGSGQIGFEEFLNMMTQTTKMDTKETIGKTFGLFDVGGTGEISFKDLKRVARELGENMSDEDLQSMLEFAKTKSGSGAVTMDEFYRLLTRRAGGAGSALDDLLDDEDD